MKKTSRFKNIQFRSEEERLKWVRSHAKYVIDFVDNNQALQRIFIHSSGEIVDCNWQAHPWVGRFVNVKRLLVGCDLEVWSDVFGGYIINWPLRIEKVWFARTFYKGKS